MSTIFRMADTMNTRPNRTFKADLPNERDESKDYGLLLLLLMPNNSSHQLGFSPVTSYSDTS